MDQYVNMLRIAFAEAVGSTDTEYLFSPQYYEWKYGTPFGEARIALIYDGDEIVASNAMIPLKIVGNGETIRAWQSCDTATHPKARKQGHFLTCITALKAQVSEGEIFFGYPNVNSRRGFARLGWSERAEFPVWVRIIPGRRLARYGDVTRIEEFSSDYDSFFEQVERRADTMTARNAAYMNWRYFNHPYKRYEAFVAGSGSTIDGVVVLRTARISGRKAALVMELLASSPKVEARLLGFASAWARSRRAAMTAWMGSHVRHGSAIKALYAPVPRALLPRRQILAGEANGETAQRVWSNDWCVSFGDWDAF